MTILEMIFILGCAALAACGGLVLTSGLGRRQVPAGPPVDRSSMSFLFRDCDLQHASPEGNALLSTATAETDWHALRATLNARFPEFPDDDALRKIGTAVIPAADPKDSGIIRLTREDEMMHVEISDTNTGDAHSVHTIRTLQAKCDTLELAAEAAPYPIWTLGSDGSVDWYNQSYGRLLREYAIADEDTPLFDTTNLEHMSGGSARSSVSSSRDGRDTWFDITLTKRKTQTVCHAVDINAVIQAEIAQRNFVQTLAKTFAQLSIGLAIFDRNGQLALFNPALVDLTSLPIEFLSGRPDLLSFFDHLRENRVMPEPKNYMTWRHEITDLIAAATQSSYEETWSLDTGHTYRISGRPHPDGAVAFLIEDITAEISLTRNFRAELELGQSMMDSIDEGLAVFSSTGILTFCNTAYRKMWKVDPDNSFADITIHDSQKIWQEMCAPDPTFGDIRDFVLRIGDRAAWESTLRHNDGYRLLLHLAPIVAGSTLIRFSVHEDALHSKAPLLT